MHDTAAVDMFVVVTARFQLLYALVVLGHERRKVIHFDVTPNPTQGWLARQITEAFPWDTAPRFLLRDRDASYGQTFRDRVQAMAIEEVVTAPRSPWQNAYVERIIGSIRRECLDHVIVFDERHLRRVLSAYFRVSPPKPHASLARTRIVRSLGPYSRPLQAPLSPSHRSAVCTIATSVAQPELFAVTEPATAVSARCVRRGLQLRRSNAGALIAHGGRLRRKRAALYSNSRKSSAMVFIGKPISWPDGILTKDSLRSWSTRDEIAASTLPFSARSSSKFIEPSCFITSPRNMQRHSPVSLLIAYYLPRKCHDRTSGR